MLPQILPAEDKDVVRVVERVFKKQGIKILTGTPISDVEAGQEVGEGEGRRRDDRGRVPGDRRRARRPTPRGSGVDAAGVKVGDGGRVEIDEYQRTSNAKVYAIGDLVRGPALAHKAQEEGIVAAETIAGAPTHPVDPDLVPGATFCHPQVASIGLTEQQAKDAGEDVKTAR